MVHKSKIGLRVFLVSSINVQYQHKSSVFPYRTFGKAIFLSKDKNVLEHALSHPILIFQQIKTVL